METAEFEKIRYEPSDGVALITLNSPERRNAWGGRMSVEYRWALHHAHSDDQVRVVVVTGSGDDFCVGADTQDLGDIERSGGKYERSSLEIAPFPDGTPESYQRNHAYPLCISKPVIAAVNGRCAGVGFLVASYADFRFGEEGGVLKTAFSRLGLPAEYGLGWILPRIMGRTNALQILLEGERMSGAEALRLGWLQKLFPPGELLANTMDYARKLARHSSGYSLSCMKRQVLFDAEGDFSEAYSRSVEDMNAALKRPDFKEGLSALRERRDTNFLNLEQK
ncbi:MAG: enoyl-CoA hydratase-related protein [Pseudomonadota bacterium]